MHYRNLIDTLEINIKDTDESIQKQSSREDDEMARTALAKLRAQRQVFKTSLENSTNILRDLKTYDDTDSNDVEKPLSQRGIIAQVYRRCVLFESCFSPLRMFQD